MIKLNNIDIYLSRLISALCLFWILAEANVWLDPVNNVLLVLGYRLFILFTPLLFLLFKHKLTFAAIFILELGIALWILNLTLIGTVCFAVGISVSGYMLKYYSSFSNKGAAGNKIALNLGSILSGCMITLSFNKMTTLISCGLFICISLFSFAKYFHRANIAEFDSKKNHFSLMSIASIKGCAWAIVGFVTGVKLISFVSILPQLAMENNNRVLPHWFGLLLILNSLIVIMFQMPIMNFVSKFTKIQATLPLYLAMLIILFSFAFNISSVLGATIWVLTLSIVECFVSFLDKLALDDNCLLTKEITVGLGSALKVYFVRYFSPDVGAIYIGLISIVLLVISTILFSTETRSRFFKLPASISSA